MAAIKSAATSWSSQGLQSYRDLVCDERTDNFIARHTDKIEGILSCFDRVIFRGYLPLFNGGAMAAYFASHGVKGHELKGFLLHLLLPEILAPMTYYWVTTQAEFAKDVLSFLGRKLTGHFNRVAESSIG